LPTDGHLGQIVREAVLQRNGGVWGEAHPIQPTDGAAGELCAASTSVTNIDQANPRS
jgi:hypothetical protein